MPLIPLGHSFLTSEFISSVYSLCLLGYILMLYLELPPSHWEFRNLIGTQWTFVKWMKAGGWID